MNPEYFEKWSELAKTMQEPLQAFAELNLKTMQQVNYLKPEELVKIKNPEKLLEEQINRAIENSHQALNYLQQSFQIFEKILLSTIQESKKQYDQKK